MILASAQTEPGQKTTEENLEDHYRFVRLASVQGAHLIVFPEMSLTGYEIRNAGMLSFTENDVRLDGLRDLSSNLGITIVAGAPIKINSSLYIGSFILSPDHSVSIYTKQYLHSGEELSFEPSFEHNPVIKLGSEKLSFAICADIDNPLHPKQAHAAGSTTYLASIFYSKKGLPKAHELLEDYARKFTMNVLMANFCGTTWGMEAGGQSGFWDDQGHLVAALDEKLPGLLIVENSNGRWSGKKFADSEA